MRHALVAIVVAALGAVPVSANCNPAKLAGTFNEANYVYIDMGPGVTNAGVVGAFYTCGVPAQNNGTYPASEWLFVDIGGKLSMQANLGDARVNGCPAGKLVTRLQSQPAGGATTPPRFLTMVATEGAAGTSSAFDYSYLRQPGSMLVSVPIPRPRVTSSSRGPGGTVLLNVALDPVASGNTSGDACGAVTGYEIVRSVGSDPGRDPSGWTVVQDVPNDGSGTTTSFPASCNDPNGDEFFATRLLFGDGQKGDMVSRSFRVNCHPALAEPDFTLVPKRPAGPAKKPGTP